MGPTDSLRERFTASQVGPKAAPSALLDQAFPEASAERRPRSLALNVLGWLLLLALSALPRLGRGEAADRFWSEHLLVRSQVALLWLEHRMHGVDQ